MKSIAILMFCLASLAAISYAGGEENIININCYNQSFGSIVGGYVSILNSDGSFYMNVDPYTPVPVTTGNNYRFYSVFDYLGPGQGYFSGDVVKHQFWARNGYQNIGHKIRADRYIQDGDTYLAAQYYDLNHATIDVKMDGVLQPNSGIYFWDPWKVTGTDGNGYPLQNTVWDSYPRSFTPGYGNYASYYGLFLYVPYVDESHPVYKVKGDLTTTIDGSTSKFQQWTTSSYTTAYSPTANETPIYIGTNNAEITANYKGRLRTNRPDLADTKNQRRVITNDNVWVTVYESMGDIWITTSQDGGVNWSAETRLNTQQGLASNPTVSNLLMYNGSMPCFLVAWTEPSANGTTLHFQTLQLWGGATPYWGWEYYPANGQDATNHKTLNEIPRGQPGGGAGTWPLRSDARPVLQLLQNGSNIETYFAYESASNGIQTGHLITPFNADLAGTYIYGYDLTGPWVLNASTYTSVQYPVIITYPASYGYPGKTYVYYLTGGYASGLRIAQFDYDTWGESVLPNTNNDYTYFSLQGAASPGNNTYGLVAEALWYNQYQYNVNYYYKPTYYGSSMPSLVTVYSNMRQPSIMFDQSTGFGTSSAAGTIVMKSTSNNEFYQSPSLSEIGPNIAGMFAKERVVPGDKTSMVMKTTTNPATLLKYSGSGLAKTAGAGAPNVQVVRLWTNEGGKEQRAILDFSGAKVEILDTLERGSDICVVQAIEIKNSIVRQVDSLCVPLSVTLKRDGKSIRTYPASMWRTLTTGSLPDLEQGDIIAFTLPGKNKTGGYSIVSLPDVSLQKGIATGDILTAADHKVGVFPNPFNPTTMFRIDLPQPEKVRLAVYNLLGQQVGELINGELDAGEHFVPFDGHNLSSGVYFYRMEFGNKLESGRLLLMK